MPTSLLSCWRCGSKEHKDAHCPHGLFGALAGGRCQRCGAKEHGTGQCPHGLFSGNKCINCGSVEHASHQCRQGLLFKACLSCKSKEHATEDCPHGVLGTLLFGGACTVCGAKNHNAGSCPQIGNDKRDAPTGTTDVTSFTDYEEREREILWTRDMQESARELVQAARSMHAEKFRGQPFTAEYLEQIMLAHQSINPDFGSKLRRMGGAEAVLRMADGPDLPTDGLNLDPGPETSSAAPEDGGSSLGRTLLRWAVAFAMGWGLCELLVWGLRWLWPS